MLDGDSVSPPQKGFGARRCLLFLAVLVWKGYMPAPRFTICVLVIIEFWLNILWNPVSLLTLFVPKIDMQYVRSYRYRNVFWKHRSLSQKHLKPSLGNGNVHRRRNLDRERPASEICLHLYSLYVFYLLNYYRIRGNPCMESRDVFICAKNSQTSMKLP